MDAVVQYRGVCPGSFRPLRNGTAHWRDTAAGHRKRRFLRNKAVRFQEDKAFEFRTEFFNLLKHYNPDPATVDLNIRSATFGMVGGGVQGITTRVIQLGAKLVF